MFHLPPDAAVRFSSSNRTSSQTNTTKSTPSKTDTSKDTSSNPSKNIQMTVFKAKPLQIPQPASRHLKLE